MLVIREEQGNTTFQEPLEAMWGLDHSCEGKELNRRNHHNNVHSINIMPSNVNKKVVIIINYGIVAPK